MTSCKNVQFLTVTHMSACMGGSLAAGGGSAVLPVTVTLPFQGFGAVTVFGTVGWRRGVLVGDAVSALGGALDAALADEPFQGLGDGCGPGCGAFADLALGERGVGVVEGVEDAPFGGVRFGLGPVGLGRSQPQDWSVAVVGECDFEVFEAGSVAMLDGHEDALVAPFQIQVRVAPLILRTGLMGLN